MKKKPEIEGKLAAIKDMRNFASDLMKQGLGDKLMKKVTVASDSKEGLKKGLEKAEELMEKTPEMDSEESAEENEEMAEEKIEGSEDNYMEEILEKCDTPEKIDELISKLQAKKEELK